LESIPGLLISLKILAQIHLLQTLFNSTMSAKFPTLTNLPAARFAAPDKRKSWLFNIAVQRKALSADRTSPLLFQPSSQP
jgi:hypothetical protein